jgi:hypothetical protein
MLRRPFAVALALLLAALQPAAARDPMWHVDGGRLVDGAGRPVRMRGFNLGNWLMWEGWMFGGALVNGESAMMARLADGAGADAARAFRRDYQDAFITEDDIAAIAGAGFNTLRLPINYRALVTDADCLACDGRGLHYIDRLLGWAKRHGLHVVLDMHGVPGAQAGVLTADAVEGSVPRYWGDPGDGARLAALWTMLARRYAGNETVAGYDLVNEPVAPSGAVLLGAYDALIAAIRTVDRRHMIWLEGNAMSADLSVFARPMGANVGYSIHMYTFPSDDRRRRTDLATATAARLGAPVWIGEWGLMDTALSADTVRMIEAAPGVAGWSYWTWKRAASDRPSPCALDMPEPWKAVVPWVTGAPSAPKPSREALTAGMASLVAFLRAHRCAPDSALMTALGARQASVG